MNPYLYVISHVKRPAQTPPHLHLLLGFYLAQFFRRRPLPLRLPGLIEVIEVSPAYEFYRFQLAEWFTRGLLGGKLADRAGLVPRQIRPLRVTEAAVKPEHRRKSVL